MTPQPSPTPKNDTTLAERLRDFDHRVSRGRWNDDDACDAFVLLREAAERITQLEAALRSIARSVGGMALDPEGDAREWLLADINDRAIRALVGASVRPETALGHPDTSKAPEGLHGAGKGIQTDSGDTQP